MRFCILRSGSSGNCTFVEHRNTRLLLDAGGVSKRSLLAILAEIGRNLDRIAGLVITHTHSDHVGIPMLRACRSLHIPIWAHAENVAVVQGIAQRAGIEGLTINPFSDAPFCVGEITFRAFGVSHDAANVTSGFVFFPTESPERFVAYAADLGHFEPHLLENFRGARTVVLESNHDLDMLWGNPNRHFVNKRRVAGDRGHLSNAQAGKALVEIFRASSPVPARIILCHLSHDHNTPDLAVETVGSILGESGIKAEVIAACRDRCTPVFDV